MALRKFITYDLPEGVDDFYDAPRPDEPHYADLHDLLHRLRDEKGITFSLEVFTHGSEELHCFRFRKEKADYIVEAINSLMHHKIHVTVGSRGVNQVYRLIKHLQDYYEN